MPDMTAPMGASGVTDDGMSRALRSRFRSIPCPHRPRSWRIFDPSCPGLAQIARNPSQGCNARAFRKPFPGKKQNERALIKEWRQLNFRWLARNLERIFVDVLTSFFWYQGFLGRRNVKIISRNNFAKLSRLFCGILRSLGVIFREVRKKEAKTERRERICAFSFKFFVTRGNAFTRRELIFPNPKSIS